MAAGKWLSWAGYEIAKVHEAQQRQAAYEARWRRSQLALMVELRAGRITLGDAARALAGLEKRAWRRDPTWWNAQRALLAALANGELTMKAAALNLGMIAPGEE